MFWVHVLQENSLKYFFQDPKNLAVCSLSVAILNSLTALTDDFIFSQNFLCLPHLQNGIANSEMVYLCPVNFCTTSWGFFLKKLQKSINNSS